MNRLLACSAALVLLSGALPGEMVVRTKDGRKFTLPVSGAELQSIEFVNAAASAPPVATAPAPAVNLSGNDWNYGSETRVGVTQQGASVTVTAVNMGHGTPGPHYQIVGTISGRTLSGNWRWIGTTNIFKGDRRFIEARCTSGHITADIAPDAKSFRITSAEDPCGHGWNGIVFKR